MDTLALAGMLDNVDGSTEVDAPAGGDADLAGDPSIQEMAHEFADALTDELRDIVFQEHRALRSSACCPSPRFYMPSATMMGIVIKSNRAQIYILSTYIK